MGDEAEKDSYMVDSDVSDISSGIGTFVEPEIRILHVRHISDFPSFRTQ